MHRIHQFPDSGRIAPDSRALRLQPHGGLDYRHYELRARAARAKAAAELGARIRHAVSGLLHRLSGSPSAISQG